MVAFALASLLLCFTFVPDPFPGERITFECSKIEKDLEAELREAEKEIEELKRE